MRKSKPDVLDAETSRQLDAIDRMEAFKGQDSVISDRLPRQKQALEARLDDLYEHLARSSKDQLAVAFARARIEQIDRILNRMTAKPLTVRDWITFVFGLGGLATAIITLLTRH